MFDNQGRLEKEMAAEWSACPRMIHTPRQGETGERRESTLKKRQKSVDIEN